MKKAVPAALDRFQDSLDELESEVRQAQAVLRRDLALLQADRLKREQAEAAERQRLATESSAKKNVAPKTEEPAPTTNAPEVKKEESAKEGESPLPDVQPSKPKEAPEPPPPIETTAEPAHDPLFDPTPATGNAQDTEFDFDALFGDPLGDNSEAAGADNTDSQGDVNMDGTADLNFNLEDSGDSGPSLLRGLEDFAKGGDDDTATQSRTNIDLDFAMPDLPDLPSTEQPSAAKPEDTSTTQQPTDDGENADLLTTMEADGLDDLFNMDYENPETTEFDDAFFGFGES